MEPLTWVTSDSAGSAACPCRGASSPLPHHGEPATTAFHSAGACAATKRVTGNNINVTEGSCSCCSTCWSRYDAVTCTTGSKWRQEPPKRGRGHHQHGTTVRFDSVHAGCSGMNRMPENGDGQSITQYLLPRTQLFTRPVLCASIALTHKERACLVGPTTEIVDSLWGRRRRASVLCRHVRAAPFQVVVIPANPCKGTHSCRRSSGIAPSGRTGACRQTKRQDEQQQKMRAQT